jgi:hypothetical protein
MWAAVPATPTRNFPLRVASMLMHGSIGHCRYRHVTIRRAGVGTPRRIASRPPCCDGDSSCKVRRRQAVISIIPTEWWQRCRPLVGQSIHPKWVQHYIGCQWANLKVGQRRGGDSDLPPPPRSLRAEAGELHLRPDSNHHSILPSIPRVRHQNSVRHGRRLWRRPVGPGCCSPPRAPSGAWDTRGGGAPGNPGRQRRARGDRQARPVVGGEPGQESCSGEDITGRTES